jgi:uncharacterized membrane protein
MVADGDRASRFRDTGGYHDGMSEYLSREQAQAVEQSIASIEARTGVQVLVALIGRCDAYPEVRWKAFALGVSLSALAVLVLDVARPAWHPGLLGALVAVLATGAANALLAHYGGAYGRRFVRHDRAEAQARDYAETLFLRRALYATPTRSAVLILLGLFERVAVVHPDHGIADRVAQADWQRIVETMAPRLAAGQRQAAIVAGLQALADLLERQAHLTRPAAPGNVFPDRPIEERGA